MFNDSNKRVLILGSRGFIGKSIVDSLSKGSVFSVCGFSSSEVNLTRKEDVASLRTALKKKSTIVMTSAITPDKNNSLDSMLDNIKMVSNLADILHSSLVKHLIYISSVDVYGRTNLDIPLSESSKTCPSDYYAISKLVGELIFNKACQDKQIPLTILRLPGVYGPGDTHLSPIKIFITSAIDYKEIRVYGDGSDLRDYIFINDISRIIKQISLNKITGTYNIVTGESHSINEILKYIEEIAQKSLTIHFEKRTKEKVDLVFKRSSLLDKIPEFEVTKLKNGLTHTYKHYSKMCQV